MNPGEELFDHNNDGTLDFGESMERDYIINEELSDDPENDTAENDVGFSGSTSRRSYTTGSSYNTSTFSAANNKNTQKKMGFETVDGLAAGLTFAICGIGLMAVEEFLIVGLIGVVLGLIFLFTER